MIRPALLLAALPLCLAAPALATAPDPGPLGRWNPGTRGGVVEIHRCGQALCGRVVDGQPLRANPDQRDVRNGDPALRTRRLMHLRVLENLEPDGDRWTGGPVYDPNSGDRARTATLTLTDANTLRIKGCIAPLLCRTQTWTRAR